MKSAIVLKREEFRVRMRRDSVEREFSKRRWQELGGPVGMREEYPSVQQQSPIDAPTIFPQMVASLSAPDNLLTTLQTIQTCLAQAIEQLTPIIIETHLCNELIRILFEQRSERRLVHICLLNLLGIAEASIELRAELLRSSLIGNLNCFLAQTPLASWTECLDAVLSIMYQMVWEKNRIPKEKTEELIVSINTICKEDVELEQETVKELLRVLNEYLRDSLSNIRAVIQKKRLFKRIFELVFETREINVWALIVVEKLTRGTPQQRAEILIKRPSLLYDLIQLLCPQYAKQATKRLKVKVYQILANFIHDPTPAIEAALYQDGIALRILELGKNERQPQVTMEVLECCYYLSVFTPEPYRDELLHNGLLELALASLDLVHMPFLLDPSLQCLREIAQWQEDIDGPMQPESYLKQLLEPHIPRLELITEQFGSESRIYQLANLVLQLLQ